MDVIATGDSIQNAPWGELSSTAAVARGARGAIIEGFVRDIRMIEPLNFPIFSTGMKSLDSNGRGPLTSYKQPRLRVKNNSRAEFEKGAFRRDVYK